ncbi:hypothetical protein VCHA34P112_260044 [Vibrio chagasii]|nr:hypothetical protein VCHA34P112_260044 [Vibrio chagasii]CAH7189208.1 hypothetical protein VCHA53O463_250044 [Vibrio chagasii]
MTTYALILIKYLTLIYLSYDELHNKYVSSESWNVTLRSVTDLI